MTKVAERHEEALAELKRRRAIEDEAVALGAELRATLAEKARVEREMRDLSRAVPRGQILRIAECMKVSRATVHRWRKK